MVSKEQKYRLKSGRKRRLSRKQGTLEGKEGANEYIVEIFLAQKRHGLVEFKEKDTLGIPW
jgi:hypothetical protein